MTNWIDVNDRLPEDREWVLASDFEDIYLLEFIETTDNRHKKRDGYFDDHSDSEMYEILKWIPLPNLPERKND